MNETDIIKTIQVPKLIFDTEKLKVGMKVKYFENWTSYNMDDIQNSISGINEIECVIREVSENSLVLIELKESIGSLRDNEIVYHYIHRIKPDDNHKIELYG